jgi:Histidine kinase-, DNA gyrase B-, and HSP90-like ATPase
MEDKQLPLLPTYGDDFLVKHAGKIITDPNFAIVELVANAWDAGAMNVRITWPTASNGGICVEDDGTGMTEDEFKQRWLRLNYNRLDVQGKHVTFPPNKKSKKRMAFGRNGVGRHAMFSFSDEYFVETCNAGRYIKAVIRKSEGDTPYKVDIQKRGKRKQHGTSIYVSQSNLTAHLLSNEMSEKKIADLIGSRFISDPEFNIFVNNEPVTFEDLKNLSAEIFAEIPNGEKIHIRRFDSESIGRTTKQSGIAWWVNNRLVGRPTWDGYEGSILDGRHNIAKRYIYIVNADALVENVKPDWSGFYASPQVNLVRRAVSSEIEKDLLSLTSDVRKERKNAAISANRNNIRKLPTISKQQIYNFADEVQVTCPTISSRDLGNVISTLAKLESARTGYLLMDKLSQLDYQDLDGLYSILEDWSIKDAQKVLGELQYRLELISRLEKLVDVKTTDELHELQPLFERGLWIFGPKFESIEFTSNRALSTVVRKFFGDAVLTIPKHRPDFVIIPDTSLGIYSCDSFDSQNEVAGVSSVIIVELKRGGFTIYDDEKDQAMRYARELRRSGKVTKETEITCYVLGSSIAPEAEEVSTDGKITVYPRAYSTILRQANARTFHLLKSLEKFDTYRKTSLEEEDTLMDLEIEQPSIFDDEVI